MQRLSLSLCLHLSLTSVLCRCVVKLFAWFGQGRVVASPCHMTMPQLGCALTSERLTGFWNSVGLAGETCTLAASPLNICVACMCSHQCTSNCCSIASSACCRASSTAQVPQAKPDAILVLPGGLKILSLGRIEFLNPKWHTKHLIYPVGYHVCPRIVTSVCMCLRMFVCAFACGLSRSSAPADSCCWDGFQCDLFSGGVASRACEHVCRPLERLSSLEHCKTCISM